MNVVYEMLHEMHGIELTLAWTTALLLYVCGREMKKIMAFIAPGFTEKQKTIINKARECFSNLLERNVVTRIVDKRRDTSVYEIEHLQTAENYLSECGFKYHHDALTRGYISRRSLGRIEYYAGRFGIGFAIEVPTTEGTQYHKIKYYIYEGSEKIYE